MPVSMPPAFGLSPHGSPMNPVKLAAIVLLVAGVLALVYGGFSYTKDTTAVKLGRVMKNSLSHAGKDDSLKL